jgi:hypothetical protein
MSLFVYFLSISIWILGKIGLLIFYRKQKHNYSQIILTSLFTYLFIGSAMFGFKVYFETLDAFFGINLNKTSLLGTGFPLIIDAVSTFQVNKIKLAGDVKKSGLYLELVRGFVFFLFSYVLMFLFLIILLLKIIIG